MTSKLSNSFSIPVLPEAGLHLENWYWPVLACLYSLRQKPTIILLTQLVLTLWAPCVSSFFLLVYRISFLDWDTVHIWWSPQYRMHMSVSSAYKMPKLQAFWSAHANLQHPEFFLCPCTLISSLRGEHYSDFNFICSWTWNMNHATNLLAL